MLILSGFLFRRETLEEFHDLHDRDDKEAEADGHDILIELHAGEVERCGDERHLAHERREEQRRHGRGEQRPVARAHREDAAALRAHVQAVEDLCHGHGEERHRCAVGAQAVRRNLPNAGLHEVADEVRGEHEHRDHQSLIRNVSAHAAGEDAGLRAARAALHDVLFGVFHAERERREAVGHKVDPEQMHRLEDREAHKRRNEDADDLAHV